MESGGGTLSPLPATPSEAMSRDAVGRGSDVALPPPPSQAARKMTATAPEATASHLEQQCMVVHGAATRPNRVRTE